MARAEKDGALAATALDSLALVLTAQDKYPEAVAAWDEAATLATRAKAPGIAVRARKNKADAALAARAFTDAQHWAEAAAKAAKPCRTATTKPSLSWARAGFYSASSSRPRSTKTPCACAPSSQRSRRQNRHRHRRPPRAFLRPRYQGALYEFEKKLDEAATLTRRALALAQQAQTPDGIYRWQWQNARLLAKQGQRDAAIEAYRRAVKTLENIRNDVAIRSGNRNARSSFREAVGALYTELADLLLQRADTLKDPAEIQALLREARGTSELLKSAELEDYFQDDCVSLLKSKTKTVENISRRPP